MNRDDALKALRQLSKVPAMSVAPQELVRQHMAEGDRAAIILAGSLLDDMLREALVLKFTTINSEEIKRLFDLNGPLGAFSSRIKLAQGLGIIDRDTTNRIEVVRALRNAAAHAQGVITFDTPEIREALISLFRSDYHPALSQLPATSLRNLFAIQCAVLTTLVTNSPESQKYTPDMLAEAAIAQHEDTDR